VRNDSDRKRREARSEKREARREEKRREARRRPKQNQSEYCVEVKFVQRVGMEEKGKETRKAAKLLSYTYKETRISSPLLPITYHTNPTNN